MTTNAEQLIAGLWRHSHEEDTATEEVYRRGDYAFGPSRGRTGYEFRKDHTCSYLGISARDGTAAESCAWSLRGGASPQVVLTFSGGRTKVLRLVSVDRERLVLSK